MKNNTPNPLVFLGAAKRLHANSKLRSRHEMTLVSRTSPFACDCIACEQAGEDYPNYIESRESSEGKFFSEYFEPDNAEKDRGGFGWWKVGDGVNYDGHDYESRLIALLLCYEMIRSEKRG